MCIEEEKMNEWWIFTDNKCFESISNKIMMLEPIHKSDIKVVE